MNKRFILNVLLLLCSFSALVAKPNAQRTRVKRIPVVTGIKKETTPKTQSNDTNIEQITNPAVKENNAEKATINPWRFSAKVAIGAAVSVCAHYVLEYMATYVHEHGHGLTGGNPNYTIEVIPSGNLLGPWHGACHGTHGSFLSIAAGPIAGLCARYIQCMAIETLDGYMQGKSLKESAQQGLRHPFLFFSKAKQTAKNYCSYALNKETDEQISEPTWSSVMLNCLLFLRCRSLLGEFTYGLMPYSHPLANGNGDGERLWRMLFGNNCPTFNPDLKTFTLGILSAPYLLGMLEAWQLKDTKKNTETTTA